MRVSMVVCNCRTARDIMLALLRGLYPLAIARWQSPLHLQVVRYAYGAGDALNNQTQRWHCLCQSYCLCTPGSCFPLPACGTSNLIYWQLHDGNYRPLIQRTRVGSIIIPLTHISQCVQHANTSRFTKYITHILCMCSTLDTGCALQLQSNKPFTANDALTPSD
ncbi:hypothetical protein FIBSPDRAFT_357072 [Athelia psychrophila]|uniref:Uncharacterized protein n=1 Tax=Athelia psychrophila TaxID=1759441 RepID=A0A166PHY1_9AGAM|nr:hypothetical protein FIBSPDRAFT_357072 [Fibularhizoctonia sp. CBS 109695]